MALYEPKQKLKKFNGILISLLEVDVNPGEILFPMWNFTNSQPNVTNIAYKILEDTSQKSSKISLINKIPWNGGSHTVEITIYTADPGNPSEHTSNNSDDAEIDKDAQG